MAWGATKWVSTNMLECWSAGVVDCWTVRCWCIKFPHVHVQLDDHPPVAGFFASCLCCLLRMIFERTSRTRCSPHRARRACFVWEGSLIRSCDRRRPLLAYTLPWLNISLNLVVEAHWPVAGSHFRCVGDHVDDLRHPRVVRHRAVAVALCGAGRDRVLQLLDHARHVGWRGLRQRVELVHDLWGHRPPPQGHPPWCFRCACLVGRRRQIEHHSTQSNGVSKFVSVFVCPSRSIQEGLWGQNWSACKRTHSRQSCERQALGVEFSLRKLCV